MKLSFKLKLSDIQGVTFKEKLAFYVTVKFQMFPELATEFKSQNYTSPITVKLNEEYNDQDQIENVGEIELPFGTVECELKFKKASEEDD